MRKLKIFFTWFASIVAGCVLADLLVLYITIGPEFERWIDAYKTWGPYERVWSLAIFVAVMMTVQRSLRKKFDLED